MTSTICQFQKALSHTLFTKHLFGITTSFERRRDLEALLSPVAYIICGLNFFIKTCLYLNFL